MHLLYFFSRGCPQVLQEKFEAVPSANGGATAIFPISPFSQFTASRGKIRLCTFYTFFLGGVPRYCRRNLRPFRPQTAGLRRFFRFCRFLNLPPLEAKFDYAPSILFSSGVELDSTQNLRLFTFSFTILALKMAEISDFLVFSDTAKEQHQCPL